MISPLYVLSSSFLSFALFLVLLSFFFYFSLSLSLLHRTFSSLTESIDNDPIVNSQEIGI
jgi:hypothetical protein